MEKFRSTVGEQRESVPRFVQMQNRRLGIWNELLAPFAFGHELDQPLRDRRADSAAFGRRKTQHCPVFGDVMVPE